MQIYVFLKVSKQTITYKREDGLDLSGFEDFNQVSIGNLSVTPRFYGAVGANRIPPIIEQYLTGIRISGPATISVKRS